jgi:hypothetical protein
MGFFTDRERNELKKLPEVGGGGRAFVRPQQQDRRPASAARTHSAPTSGVAPRSQSETRSQSDTKAASEPASADPGSMLQSAAHAQVREIDILITDLQMMREKLRSEASRVQRVMVEYATFSENASQSSKVICESLRNGLRPFQQERHKEKGRSRARRKAARRLARLAMRTGSPEPLERKREIQGD